MRERVVVTGLGAVSPLGLTVLETWQNLIEGKSGIRKIDPSVNSQVSFGGVVENFDPEKYIPGKELPRIHRSAQFSCAAITEAVLDAHLEKLSPEDIGIRMGTGIGGGGEIAEMEDIILKYGDHKISQYSMLRLLPERISTSPSRLDNLRGPTATTVAACATGSISITDALYTLC